MKKNLWIPRQMFYRVLWPALISALALAVADIADALVVGAQVGEKGLAAIGIVTPVYMVYNLIGYGFSTGGCVTHGKLTSAARNYDALCHFRIRAGFALITVIHPIVIHLAAGPVGDAKIDIRIQRT